MRELKGLLFALYPVIPRKGVGLAIDSGLLGLWRSQVDNSQSLSLRLDFQVEDSLLCK